LNWHDYDDEEEEQEEQEEEENKHSKNKNKQTNYYKKKLKDEYTKEELEKMEQSNKKEIRREGRNLESYKNKLKDYDNNRDYYNNKKKKRDNKKKTRKMNKELKFQQQREQLRNQYRNFKNNNYNNGDLINKKTDYNKNLINNNKFYMKKEVVDNFMENNKQELLKKDENLTITKDLINMTEGIASDTIGSTDAVGNYFYNFEKQEFMQDAVGLSYVTQLPLNIRNKKKKNKNKIKLKLKNHSYKESDELIDVLSIFIPYHYFQYEFTNNLLGNKQNFIYMNNKECISNYNNIEEIEGKIDENIKKYKLQINNLGLLKVVSTENDIYLIDNKNIKYLITPYGLISSDIKNIDENSSNKIKYKNIIRNKIIELLNEENMVKYQNKINNIKDDNILAILKYSKVDKETKLTILTRHMYLYPPLLQHNMIKHFNFKALEDLNWKFYAQVNFDTD
jgi:hydrogenase maturation factor